MFLSPCPYCSDTNVVVLEVDIHAWTVVCDRCQASGPAMVTESIAIQAWERVAGEKLQSGQE